MVGLHHISFKIFFLSVSPSLSLLLSQFLERKGVRRERIKGGEMREKGKIGGEKRIERERLIRFKMILRDEYIKFGAI